MGRVSISALNLMSYAPQSQKRPPHNKNGSLRLREEFHRLAPNHERIFVRDVHDGNNF